MATQAEVREALDDYVTQANNNPRVRRTFRTWNCVIQVNVIDIDALFTMVVKNGEVASVQDGATETPDLIINGNSEDLTNIFWGDADPASNYMQGAITTKGSQDHVMRLDAMAMMIYLKS